MGYSGRYHAASLVAVFIALAVGILIGIGLANDVVSSASQELESSLRSDLGSAQDERDALQAELSREQDFSRLAYPALVSGRLEGSRVAVVSFGELPDSLRSNLETALEPTGAAIAAAAVVEPTPNLDKLRQSLPAALTGGRAEAVLTGLGERVGRQLAGDGQLVQLLRGQLFSKFSGSLRGVDRVIFVNAAPADSSASADQPLYAALRSGIFRGAEASAAAAAGVERTDQDPTSLEPMMAAGVPTADDVDLVAGRLALVSILLGAEGDYGVKAGADSYLPELLDSAPDSQPTAPQGSGRDGAGAGGTGTGGSAP